MGRLVLLLLLLGLLVTVAASASAFASSAAEDRPSVLERGQGQSGLQRSSQAGYAYESRAGLGARFPTEIAADPVRISDRGAWLAFALEGGRARAQRRANVVTYRDALPGVSLAYLVGPGSVKEFLVLGGPHVPSEWRFSVSASRGLGARENARGGIDFRDRSGRLAFSFAPPYMVDSAGAVSDAVSLSLRGAKGRYRVTLAANARWLMHPARRFPVGVDPTICEPGDLVCDTIGCGREFPCPSIADPCYSGQIGVQPVCVDKTQPCGGDQIGVEPFCLPAGGRCYPPEVGLQPACVTPPASPCVSDPIRCIPDVTLNPCPPGQVGVPPVCVNEPQPCYSGIGYEPYCVTPPQPCYSGIGYEPNCVTPPQPCYSGIGYEPNCVTPPQPCGPDQIGVQPFCLTPPPSPQPCYSGIGYEPNCVSPPQPCGPDQIGVQPFCVTAGGRCYPPEVGLQPACVTPPASPCVFDPIRCIPDVTLNPCPPGQVGVPPACVTPPTLCSITGGSQSPTNPACLPAPCPAGTVGVPPDCVTPPSSPCVSDPIRCIPSVTLPDCPPGQVGLSPACVGPPPSLPPVPPPACPAGQVGSPPACLTPPPPPQEICLLGNLYCVDVPPPSSRETRIDWSGDLTRSTWQRGMRCLSYDVYDEILGSRREVPLGFQRITLFVDGAVKQSASTATGQFCLDTDQIGSGVRRLALDATVDFGTRTVSKINDRLSIDHVPPAGSVGAPPAALSGEVTVRGSANDQHAGPRVWELQVVVPGRGAWERLCLDHTPDPATLQYGCDWTTDSGEFPDGSYRARAVVTDNSEPGNISTSAETSLTVDNDADNDGVPDHQDLCPTVFAQTADGCPNDDPGAGEASPGPWDGTEDPPAEPPDDAEDEEPQSSPGPDDEYGVSEPEERGTGTGQAGLDQLMAEERLLAEQTRLRFLEATRLSEAGLPTYDPTKDPGGPDGALQPCPRDRTNYYRFNTFKWKFQRAGNDRSGDRYWQYHLHYNLRQHFYPYARRSWLRLTIRKPNGRPSNEPFNDSATRRSRGSLWKPWYAHLTVRIKPHSYITYRARSEINNYPLAPGARLTAVKFYGKCHAAL